jgi:hypothetical protein
LDDALTLVRKTPAAQASTWHPVFSQDYLPARRFGTFPEGLGTPVWLPAEPENGWSDHLARVVHFRPQESVAGLAELLFRGRACADSYGYNGQSAREDEVIVSDNRLHFVLEPLEDHGLLRLQLCKRRWQIHATLNGLGEAWLTRTPRSGTGPAEELARGRSAPWRPHEQIEVDFCVLDGHAELRVGDQMVFGRPVPIAPSRAGEVRREVAREAELSPDVRLAAADGALAIHHLNLQRDVYYRSDRQLNPATRQLGWGVMGHPIYLRPVEGREQPGDYFMLGDNSPQSKDGRLWAASEVGPHLSMMRDNYQVGTVPGDQLIGRAFFVYWPAGIRPLGRAIPIVPNVGRMRFIH